MHSNHVSVVERVRSRAPWLIQYSIEKGPISSSFLNGNSVKGVSCSSCMYKPSARYSMGQRQSSSTYS